MSNNSKLKNLNPTLFNRVKSTLWLIIKYLIAFSIIGWLISNNYQAFVKVIKEIDLSWLILAILGYVLVMIGQAWRWYLLLKVQGIMVSFFETFSLTMQGVFFSLVIPGGAIGGDLVRTTFLVSRTPKGNKLAATSTVFMDRFMGMFAQFILSIVFAIPFIPQITRMDDAPKLTVILILIVSVLGLIAGFCLIIHRQLEKIPGISAIIKFTDKVTKGFLSDAFEILDVYHTQKKVMLYCIVISMVFIQLGISFILFLVAKGIHCANITINPLILSIALGNTAGLLPFTPSGLGTRDAVVKGTLTAGGFSHGDAIAIPLLFSIIMIAVSLSGGFFFLLHKRSKKNYKIIANSNYDK